MKTKKMYILVNEDIKIAQGKLSGQVGHAVCTYMYRKYIRDYTGNRIELSDEELKRIDEYMMEQKKIVLSCSEFKLKELEKEGKYIVIRDKGLTDLTPNTLTCVNCGIYEEKEVPEWIKELKLYRK